MKKILLTLLFFAPFLQPLFAQTKYDESEFKTQPVWVKMMDDPKVNYHQAVKAFDTFWEGKVKPEGEDEFLNEKGRESKKEERAREKFKKELKKMTPAKRQEFDQLKYHYKRFETWMREVKPFVQEDGRILTESERIQIWNKQQEEIREQNKPAK